MEAAMRKSDVTMAEKGVESNGDEADRKDRLVLKVGSGDERKEHGTDNMKPNSPEYKHLISCGKQVLDCDNQKVRGLEKLDTSSSEPNSEACSSTTKKNQEEQLETAKAEMGEVREENQRLKMHLDRIMKDYKTLQMQFYDIVHQEPPNCTTNTPSSTHQEMEEPGLVSLSLGRTDLHKDENRKICPNPNANPTKGVLNEKDIDEGLGLGLHLKFDVSKMGSSAQSPLNLCPENSLEKVKEEAGGDASPPRKVVKKSGDDEVMEQNPTKKARVSVRVRCDAPTMNDGCQWRKYGQKIAKGNPCPRAYYRCTVAPTCPVRKQVQRCAEDMSILITTYEGIHNHPLSVSATAMASTTSAAARMLMSDSTRSGQGSASSSATTTMATGLHGFNFYFSDRSKPKQFYVPNCNSSISSSPSYPTVTLDLTSTSPTSSFRSKTPPNYNCFPTRFSSTNLNFSSLESNRLPVPWSSTGRVLNYGSNQVSYNRTTQVGSSLNFGTQPLEASDHQPHMQRLANPPPQHSLPPDAIAAATKAITSDPSFHSALAAALTSIIGTRGGCSVNDGGRDKFEQNSKLGEPFAYVGNFPSTSNADKCSSSYLNRTASIAESQSGSLMLPFSTSCKPNPPSPVDDKDHII